MCVCAQLMLFGVEEIPSFKLPKGSSRRSFFNSFILVRRFARVGLGKCISGCFELISKDLTLIESCAFARCVELSLSHSSMHCQPAGSHSCECFFFFFALTVGGLRATLCNNTWRKKAGGFCRIEIAHICKLFQLSCANE